MCYTGSRLASPKGETLRNLYTAVIICSLQNNSVSEYNKFTLEVQVSQILFSSTCLVAVLLWQSGSLMLKFTATAHNNRREQSEFYRSIRINYLFCAFGFVP